MSDDMPAAPGDRGLGDADAADAVGPHDDADDLTGVVVAVDADHVATMGEVVDQLRDVGMVVEHTMDALGTVTGRISPERLETIAAIPGVSAVERSTSIEIPPPESDVQ